MPQTFKMETVLLRLGRNTGGRPYKPVSITVLEIQKGNAVIKELQLCRWKLRQAWPVSEGQLCGRERGDAVSEPRDLITLVIKSAPVFNLFYLPRPVRLGAANGNKHQPAIS